MNKLILLILSLIILLPHQSWSQLNFNKLPELIQTEVNLKFPEVNHKKPSLSVIDKLLKYLMSKGDFEDLEVVTSNDSHYDYELNFRISKTIESIIFLGNTEISSDMLTQVLQIEEGQKFSNHLIDDWQNKLKSYYDEQGYLRINTKIDIKELSPTDIEVIFNIEEGDPLTIENIIFKTANEVLRKKLIKITKKYLNKTLNTNILLEINRLCDELFRQGRYLKAQLSVPSKNKNENQNRVILEYTIQNPEVFEFSFEGNYSFESARLESSMELSKFKSVNPEVAPELALKIKDFYLLKGYARVEVTAIERIIKPFERIVVVSSIDEGSRTKLQNIEVSGNISKASNHYAQIIKEYSGETIQNGYFHKNQLDNGLKNLILELQNQGYLKAKLISSRYLYNKQRDQVTASINIDEGPLTKITQIEFFGNSYFKSDDLLNLMKLKTQSALKLQNLESSIELLRNSYRSSGFLEMRLINTTEVVIYNEDNTEAKLKFQIFEGPQVKVASLIVDGNSKTKEYVIRKEIEFKEGDILTPEILEESTQRLQKLGLFNSVDIKTLEENTLVADRTVVIKVTERPPGLFNLGTGVTNERDFTLRGFAGLAYRNLDGYAKSISVRIDGNYNIADLKFPELKITAGYQEPYLFDTRTKGRFNLTRATEISDYDKEIGNDVYKMEFILEQNLTSHILFSYDVWGLSTIKDFNIKRGSPFAKIDSVYYEQTIATTGPRLEFDYRDHPFNPTRGTLTRLQMEYSDPIIGSKETIKYIKSTTSFNHYLDLSDQRWILANSIRLGHLKNLSNHIDGGVPYDKKGFILGGLSTLRGFEASTNDRIPNDDDLGISDSNQGGNNSKPIPYFIRKVNTFYLLKSELRFPIYGDFGGTIFYDGGHVHVDDLKFSYGYRNSAGFGLRYITPVGPVNLEFAWKLDTRKDRGETPFRFHFSIGSF